MKTKTQFLAVTLSAFLLMSGAAMAQNSSDPDLEDNISSNDTDDSDSRLGDGVRSYSFDIQALPVGAALKGPSSSAEEDPSEVERAEEPVVRVSGFVEFETGGYEVEVESEEENRTVDLTVMIEEPEEADTQQVTRVPVEENIEVEEGSYTVNLDVVRGSQTVLERTKEVKVASSEEENSEKDKDLENMTREELIDEVKQLREKLEELRGDESDSEDNEQRQGPPEDLPANPEQGDDEDDREETNETDTGNEETNETETEEPEGNETEDSSEGPPSEAPGNSDNRPGFVNNILSGIFG